MRERSVQSTQSMRMPLTGAVSSTAEQDDLQLVTASKGGDQDAFAQLVQSYQRRVFNLVYRMLQHYDEANETTPKTFLAASQGLPAFRGESGFTTWLYLIDCHCSLQHIE